MVRVGECSDFFFLIHFPFSIPSLYHPLASKKILLVALHETHPRVLRADRQATALLLLQWMIYPHLHHPASLLFLSPCPFRLPSCITLLHPIPSFFSLELLEVYKTPTDDSLQLVVVQPRRTRAGRCTCRRRRATFRRGMCRRSWGSEGARGGVCNEGIGYVLRSAVLRQC
jgi:hypothetical protein